MGRLPDGLPVIRHVTEGSWQTIMSPEVGEDGVRVSAAVLITHPRHGATRRLRHKPRHSRGRSLSDPAHQTPTLVGVFREECTGNSVLDLSAGLPGKRVHYVGV
jgi:hypothetical protein